MTETFVIDVEMPEFMNLMDAEVKKQILKEVEGKIKTHVSELVEKTAREIVAQKLDLLSPEVPAKPADVEESTADEELVKEPELKPGEDKKTALAEKVLSLPADEALRKLRLSLAKGDIDESDYQELKALVEPITPGRVICPTCGKELEPTVSFCRFCGAKVK
jgi:hypothetical protein